MSQSPLPTPEKFESIFDLSRAIEHWRTTIIKYGQRQIGQKKQMEIKMNLQRALTDLVEMAKTDMNVREEYKDLLWRVDTITTKCGLNPWPESLPDSDSDMSFHDSQSEPLESTFKTYGKFFKNSVAQTYKYILGKQCFYRKQYYFLDMSSTKTE